MPLVFAQNEISSSGISYADITGLQYQYPKRMYKNVISPGQRFIYYRGRKTINNSSSSPIYFGTGIVGNIRDDPSDDKRLICDILYYRPFASPVPFKLGKNDYLESEGIRKGYYQMGVRRVSEQDFQRILSMADLPVDEFVYPQYRGSQNKESPYAGPSNAELVNEYACNVTVMHLELKYPTAEIQMVTGKNLGFDLLLKEDSTHRYVTVKGTRRFHPHFFMTACELNFSQENPDHYLLSIVYNINLTTWSHELLLTRGPIGNNTFGMTPTLWSVSVRT